MAAMKNQSSNEARMARKGKDCGCRNTEHGSNGDNSNAMNNSMNKDNEKDHNHLHHSHHPHHHNRRVESSLMDHHHSKVHPATPAINGSATAACPNQAASLVRRLRRAKRRLLLEHAMKDTKEAAADVESAEGTKKERDDGADDLRKTSASPRRECVYTMSHSLLTEFSISDISVEGCEESPRSAAVDDLVDAERKND